MAKQVLSPTPIGMVTDPYNAFAFLNPQATAPADPRLLAQANPTPEQPTNVTSTLPATSAQAPQPVQAAPARGLKENLYMDEGKMAQLQEAAAAQEGYQKNLAGLNDYQQLLALQAGKSVPTDISPLINYGNLLTGKKLEYKAPEQKDLLPQLQTLQKDKAQAYKDLLAGVAASKYGSYGDLLGGLGSARMINAARGISHEFSEPLLNQYQNQKTGIDRAIHTMDTATTIPYEMKHEIEQEIAQALTGKGVASEGKLKSITMDTKAQDAARFLQSFKNGPVDLKTASPDVLQYLRDTLNRLHDAYDESIKARSLSIHNRLAPIGSSDPLVRDVLRSNLRQFNAEAADSIYGASGPNPGEDPNTPKYGAMAEMKRDYESAKDWLSKNPDSPHAASVKAGMAALEAKGVK